MSGKPAKGFTLIELLVLLAVLGIVTAVALPGFSFLIESNQLTTTSNDLVGALNVARSEAVRRGQPVSVSPVSSFTDGYQVVTDDGETVNDFDGAKGSYAITLSQGSTPRFSAKGMLTNSISPIFQICQESGETGRAITVTVGGQISSSELTCP